MNQTKYAAESFQRDVLEAVQNGLTYAEAKGLVETHNWLQIQSRQELMDILRRNGYTVYLKDNMVSMDHRRHRLAHKKTITLPKEADIEWVTRDYKLPKELKPRILLPKEVIWLGIVVPAVLLALAGLVGLI